MRVSRADAALPSHFDDDRPFAVTASPVETARPFAHASNKATASATALLLTITFLASSPLR